MEKKYYYLVGTNQNGPLTLKELEEKEIDKNILIWTEGMDNWKPIEEIESKIPIVPIPSNKINLKPSKNQYLNIILWISFHFIALVLSATGLRYFNWSTSPYHYNFREFWPFSNIYEYSDYDYFSFNGIFYKYDITEFIIYITVPAILFIIYRIVNPKATFDFNSTSGRFVKTTILTSFIFWILSFFSYFNWNYFTSNNEFWPFSASSLFRHFSHDRLFLKYDHSEFITYSLISLFIFYYIQVFKKK